MSHPVVGTANSLNGSGSTGPPMTPDEARVITGEIRAAADLLWALLTVAHDRRAWAALGYASFGEYVRLELSISRAQAYRLLDQGRVIAELTAAVYPPGGSVHREGQATRRRNA